MKANGRRIGRVRIDSKCIFNKPEIWVEIIYQLKAVIVHAYQYHKEGIEYTMVSDAFDEIKDDGAYIPFYSIYADDVRLYNMDSTVKLNNVTVEMIHNKP